MDRLHHVGAGERLLEPSGRTTAERVKPSGERVRELVDRAVGGDAEAFGGLYDLYADDLYRYFYAHLGRYHDAEDLVSRTFIRAWRAIGGFKWKGRPFEAWLFTLARNQLIDFHRERRGNVTALDESRPDGRPGPEMIALAEASARETRAALEKLTVEQRQVLVLKFFMDRDNREIAAIMGKREGTVRALQMRALQALRRQRACRPDLPGRQHRSAGAGHKGGHQLCPGRARRCAGEAHAGSGQDLDERARGAGGAEY